VKIDTGLLKLKPLFVDWTWQSWYKLKQKRDVIKEGWERCGLGQVLEAAQQVEAMRFCMSEATQALGNESDHEDTDSEWEEEEEEKEEVEDD
jgi:hypothetical protein